MDLIRREKAINSVYDGTSYDILTEECKRHIEEVPSAFEGMTNGEVIKALFPNSEVIFSLNNVPKSDVIKIDNEAFLVERSWWNSPYQKGGE